MLSAMSYSPSLVRGLSAELIMESFMQHALLGQQDPTCQVIQQQSELMEAVEAIVMKQCVRVREAQPLAASEAPPIALFTPYNTAVCPTGADVRAVQRTYLGCKPNYVYVENSVRRPKKVTGRVVSVNSGRRSLVIKPRWSHISDEHCWVRMVDDNGQPLVTLSLI